jgi:sorbitol-specific phosphotransferase system component IIA
MILGKNLTYTVTAVGEVANKNLKKIGHVCLKFDATNMSGFTRRCTFKGRKDYR